MACLYCLKPLPINYGVFGQTPAVANTCPVGQVPPVGTHQYQNFGSAVVDVSPQSGTLAAALLKYALKIVKSLEPTQYNDNCFLWSNEQMPVPAGTGVLVECASQDSQLIGADPITTTAPCRLHYRGTVSDKPSKRFANGYPVGIEAIRRSSRFNRIADNAKSYRRTAT